MDLLGNHLAKHILLSVVAEVVIAEGALYLSLDHVLRGRGETDLCQLVDHVGAGEVLQILLSDLKAVLIRKVVDDYVQLKTLHQLLEVAVNLLV